MVTLNTVLIHNGRIIDGTGNPWYKADILVENGRIRKIAPQLDEDVATSIDATNKVISPGFIDAHAHSDIYLLVNPQGESMIHQGVTTQVCGNCGSSLAPLNDVNRDLIKTRYGPLADEITWDWNSFHDFLNKLENQGTSINFVSFVGNATVRTAVMGMEYRAPTILELNEMKMLVNAAMKEGAFGLSTGLYYSPSGFADTQEVIELCHVISPYGGIYHSHIRGESAMVVDSVQEAITIGEEANVPVEIAHHKAYGKAYWPLIDQTLILMEQARERGVDVTCNVYPYLFGQTGLSAMIPYWAHAGGRLALIQRLRNPETRDKLKRDMRHGLLGWESHVKATGWETIIVARCPVHEEYEGRSIAQIAVNAERDPYEVALDLMLEGLEGKGRTSIRIFGQGAEDRRKVLKSPLSTIGSDGYALAPYGILGKGFYHPRMYGCFPRLFRKYVREDGLLRLEEAVRKTTSSVAQKLGIHDRGLLREGMWADIVIFDPNRIADKATETEPYLYPEGIDYVIVNGEVTVQKGEHTTALAGHVLRKQR
jgi:N-acyl-D-amino-acid deacylase